MQMVLFALKKADEDSTDKDAKSPWLSLTGNYTFPQETTEGVEKLAETVWLIHLETAMPAFCGLVAAADYWDVPYRVHFFEENREWIGTWEPTTPSPE